MYCTECGKQIPKEAKFCPYCGNQQMDNSNVDQKLADVIVEKFTDSGEKIYYSDNNNIFVTSTRFSANGTTYVIQKIESVSFTKLVKSRSGYIIWLIVSGIAIWYAFYDFLDAWYKILYIASAVLSLICLISVKDNYSVRISTDSKIIDSVTSTNSEYIRKIVVALNESLIYNYKKKEDRADISE